MKGAFRGLRVPVSAPSTDFNASEAVARMHSRLPTGALLGNLRCQIVHHHRKARRLPTLLLFDKTDSTRDSRAKPSRLALVCREKWRGRYVGWRWE